ncbi:MAG: dimethylsulfoxide reductase subunit B [Desulfobacteraceae bacterium]|nr:MAG: dimethylsulfoxide reductase subunit B [Desulfobacteraceae bacterium]
MTRELNKWAFTLDAQQCTGCKTCMVACKDKNNLALGLRWRRVAEYCGGQWMPLPDGTFMQDVFTYYVSVSCNHCMDPICTQVCPTTAMHPDENGIVTVDQGKCMGCRYCEWACPYGAPQFDADAGRMTKCNFCEDYLSEGRSPACVSACPTRALGFGPWDELEKDARSQPDIAPLPDIKITTPCSVLVPHRMSRTQDDVTGTIANPEENKDA